MSRRIRSLAIRIAPVLTGFVLAQASAVYADTAQPTAPAPSQQSQVQQNQVQQNQAQQNRAPQNTVQQRQVPPAYRRGVTPPPISTMTLPSIGPSNYTVAHSERLYWGTAERHPDPQLYPLLPGMGQPSSNTASVYRYLPPSQTRDNAVAASPSSTPTYQNATAATQSAGSSPFGPPLQPMNGQLRDY